MKIVLNQSRLLGPMVACPELAPLIAACIKSKSALCLTVGAFEAAVSVVDDFDARREIRVKMRWRTPSFIAARKSLGTTILSPFLAYFDEVVLPARMMYTYGREERSVADFFMRNFFFAACRGECISIQHSDESRDAASCRINRELMRVYQWIAARPLQLAFADQRDAPDLLLSSTHLPAMRVGGPIAEAGVAEFRRACVNAGSLSLLQNLMGGILDARERMLAVLDRR